MVGGGWAEGQPCQGSEPLTVLLHTGTPPYTLALITLPGFLSSRHFPSNKCFQRALLAGGGPYTEAPRSPYPSLLRPSPQSPHLQSQQAAPSQDSSFCQEDPRSGLCSAPAGTLADAVTGDRVRGLAWWERGGVLSENAPGKVPAEGRARGSWET